MDNRQQSVDTDNTLTYFTNKHIAWFFDIILREWYAQLQTQFLASKLQNYMFSIYISYLLNIQAVYQYQVTIFYLCYFLLLFFFLLQVTHSFFFFKAL